MACDGYNNGSLFNVTVQGEWSNAVQTVNTYQFLLVDGGPTDMDAVSLSLRDVLDDAYDIIKGICNAVQLFEGITVAELDGDCATGLVPFVSGPIAGTLVNDPLPSGVSALISFRTGVKRVVLRKYIPGLDESITGAGGNIGSGSLIIMNSFASYLMQPQTKNGLQWRMAWRSPKLPTENLIPIGSQSAAVPAYQRRRRQGTGS